MDSFEIESSKNSLIHFHDSVIEIEVIEKDDSGFDDYRAVDDFIRFVNRVIYTDETSIRIRRNEDKSFTCNKLPTLKQIWKRSKSDTFIRIQTPRANMSYKWSSCVIKLIINLSESDYELVLDECQSETSE